MPVAVAQKVEALSKDFRSQRRLAELLDVSPAQIGRWIRGQGIDPENAERVEVLEAAMTQLLRVYDPETADAWLHGTNPFLRNRRPIDVVRAGRLDEVLGAIQAARAGSFA